MAADQKRMLEMSIKARVLTKVIGALYLFLVSAFASAQATTYFANLYNPARTQPGRAPTNQHRFRDHCAYQYVRGSMRQAQQLNTVAHQNNNSTPNTSKPTLENKSKPVPATFSTPPAPPAICTHQRQELTSTRQFLAQNQQHRASTGSYFQQERELADRLLSQALEQVLAGNNSITQEHYSLDLQTEHLLQKNNIDIQDFTHCSGNAATLQKHREIIVILNKISDLRDQSPTNKAFEEILYHFLDGASLSNKELKLFASCSLTNFCWAGLEYAYHAARGFKTGGRNIFYALSDPVGTGAHMLQAGHELGRFLGNFCAEMVAYQAHMSYQEICALNNLKPDHQLADLKALKSRLHATQSIGAILEKALKDFAKKSGPQRVGMLTEMVTEYFLSGPVAHRIARGASLLCGHAAKQAKNIMRAIKKGKQFEHAVATAGGFELRIARETLTFFENAGEAAPKNTKPLVPCYGQKLSQLNPTVGDISKLHKAVPAVHNIPVELGTESPLDRLFNCGSKMSDPKKISTARGAAYEIEKAYDLTQKGENVTMFGQKIVNAEFDIVTTTKLIECKNIDWSKKVGESAEAIKNQLGRQAKIASGQGKTFEIHSREPIPQQWKDWFKKKNIVAIEG
jgi:hypothetical protein